MLTVFDLIPLSHLYSIRWYIPLWDISIPFTYRIFLDHCVVKWIERIIYEMF